jgi:hypothetical protein
MKKAIILVLSLFLVAFPCVMAQTGTLRITPQWPVMVESPADFIVWCQNGPSYDVNVLLMVTEECHTGMTATGAVIIKYEGSIIATFDQNDFNPISGMGGVYVPPTGATEGGRFQVSALKDHLDYGMSEPLVSEDTIFWAKKPLGPDFDPLEGDTKEIEVTLNSATPRMLVYLLGRTVDDAAAPFDMKVPPTNPGFIVPEIAVGSLMAGTVMFAAFGLYAYKKKHQ